MWRMLMPTSRHYKHTFQLFLSPHTPDSIKEKKMNTTEKVRDILSGEYFTISKNLR